MATRLFAHGDSFGVHRLCLLLGHVGFQLRHPAPRRTSGRRELEEGSTVQEGRTVQKAQGARDARPRAILLLLLRFRCKLAPLPVLLLLKYEKEKKLGSSPPGVRNNLRGGRTGPSPQRSCRRRRLSP
jgi:hypothetical protein